VQSGVVILLMRIMGITMTGCAALSHANFFANDNNKNERSFNTTRGGHAFDKELAKDHRFGSSGLNLAFEGLLLGASLRLGAKPTSSNPR
jgi:hypothetical protein